MPLSKIPRAGKVTTQLLSTLGLNLCADVQKTDRTILLNQFGKMGQRIWDFSHGIDDRQINAHRERKSIAVEKTLLNDISDLQQALITTNELYSILCQRLHSSFPQLELSQLRKIGVKLKFEDFQTTALDKSHVNCDNVTFRHLIELVWQRCHGRKVRLIGLHITLPPMQQHSQMTQMSF